MDATIDRNEVDQADPGATVAAPPDLCQLAGFSWEDTWHNRAGRLSPTQRERLRHQLLIDLLLFGLTVGYTGVAFYVFGFTLINAAMVLVCLLYVYQFARMTGDLYRGMVTEREGNAWMELDPDSDGSDRYWLHLGDLTLETTQEAYDAIAAGGGYRVFYTPWSKRLVGAEVMSGWRAIPPPAPNKSVFARLLGRVSVTFGE